MNLTQITFLVLVQIATVCCAGNSGPVGDIKIHYASVCDPVPDNGVKGSVEIKRDDHDTHLLDMKLKFDFDITDEVEYLFTADKWEQGLWKEDAVTTDGKVFEFVEERMEMVWENIRNSFSPQISEADFIPAGEYVLESFYEDASTLQFPQILYGKFRVKLEIFKGDDLIFCIQAEADSIDTS